MRADATASVARAQPGAGSSPAVGLDGRAAGPAADRANDPTARSEQPLLQVSDLYVRFATRDGEVRAVNGIDFDLLPGDHLGIVGESGSGKSASALALMGLLPSNASVEGSIRFDGQELVGAGEKRLRAVRGHLMGMIYQDPFASLNPVLTVELQLSEAITAHRGLSGSEARTEAVRLLDLVGIADAERRVGDYPHQFSGGMRQRVVIAMALAGRPRMLIADEPTTALDVTIQAQILELLVEVTEQEGMALVLITHDLGIVARVTRRLQVMYAGRIVESGTTASIFRQPGHPYTEGLLASLPRVDRRQTRLSAIEGQPPDMSRPIEGCPFAPRCHRAVDRCGVDDPALVILDGAGHGHRAACWNPPPPFGQAGSDV